MFVLVAVRVVMTMRVIMAAIRSMCVIVIVIVAVSMSMRVCLLRQGMVLRECRVVSMLVAAAVGAGLGVESLLRFGDLHAQAQQHVP